MKRFIWLWLSVVAVAGCGNHAVGDEEEDELEVEVIGQLRQAPDAPKYAVAVYDVPCDEHTWGTRKPIGLDLLDEQTAADPAKQYALEAELVDGARGYLCAYAFDAQGTLIAFGRQGSQPFAYEQQGDEVGSAHGMDITLAAVSTR